MKKQIMMIVAFVIGLQFANAQSIEEDLSGKIDFVVAKDGSGDFSTIQAAVNAVPNSSSVRTIVYVKKGIYTEKVSVPASKQKLTLLGEDVQETILTYREPNGIGNAVLMVDADDFWLMNITVENKQGTAYAGPQSVALQNRNSDRNILIHCKLFSFQDTWFTNTTYRTYAKDCFIEGSVDYIFGPSVSVFDSCVLFCNRSSGAVICAANTNGDDVNPPFNKYGYVFFNSKIASLPNWNNVHNLGRPWRQKSSVIYYKCDFGNFIKSDPWIPMSNNTPENAFFYEFRCAGESAIRREGYVLPPQMALAVSQTDTSALIAEPFFDSIFNPNVIPAKRGSFPGGWNPQNELNNDNDSVYFILKKYITSYLDTIGYHEARLTKLQYDTLKIDIIPDDRTYVLNVDKIDTNQCFYPVFEYAGAGYIALRATSIPGMGTITTVAKDKTTSEIYNIYFDKDGSFTNATLQQIKIDTVTLPGFDPNTFEYHYELNDYLTERYLSGKSIRSTVYGLVQGAKVKLDNPTVKNFPDTTTISVTAPDGVTENTYTIYFTIPTTIESIEKNPLEVKFKNPVSDKMEITMQFDQAMDVEMNIYSESGSRLISKSIKNRPAGEITQTINTEHLGSGIYILSIECNQFIKTYKLVKE